MKQQKILVNENDAICTECGQWCEPYYEDGTFSYDGPSGPANHDPGGQWMSRCCDAPMDSVKGGKWVPQIEPY